MLKQIKLLAIVFTVPLLGCGGTYEYDLRDYQTADDFKWNGQFRVETRPGLVWFTTDMYRVVLAGEDGNELEISHTSGRPRVFLELQPKQAFEYGKLVATQPASTQPSGEMTEIEALP